jgi:VanZ family protein
VSLWAPLIAYMAVIFYLSSLPEVPLPGDVGDKQMHSLGYAFLGLLAVRAVAGGLPARVTPRVALLAMLITVGYGATDELHQSFVPGRSAEIYDLFADAVGGALALSACWAWGIISLRPDV